MNKLRLSQRAASLKIMGEGILLNQHPLPLAPNQTRILLIWTGLHFTLLNLVYRCLALSSTNWCAQSTQTSQEGKKNPEPYLPSRPSPQPPNQPLHQMPYLYQMKSHSKLALKNQKCLRRLKQSLCLICPVEISQLSRQEQYTLSSPPAKLYRP